MKKLLAIVLALVAIGSMFMIGYSVAVDQATLDDQELAELHAIECYGEGEYEVEIYEAEDGYDGYIRYLVLDENGICRGAASLHRGIYMNRYS